MTEKGQDTTQGAHTAQDAEQFAVIKLSVSDTTPAFPKVSINRSGGFVNFGPKNDFPQEIIRINSKSPVNSAIVRSTVTYICGKGVKRGTDANGYVGSPNTTESWETLISKVATDRKSFGGYYWQVIVNKGGTTVSLFHQDYSTVRIGQIDDKGKPLTFKISNDWTKTSGKYKPVELDVWPGMEEAQKGKAYIFYHWDYAPGLMFYSVPDYYPALEYIRADGSLGEFYNNSIDNGFTSGVIFTMASNPDQPKKDAFYKAVKAAYCGVKGANDPLIIWGEGGEVSAKVAAFNASNNADVYNNVERIVFQKIISANRLSSPTLAGVSGSGNLSGNAAEIVDAFILHSYTVIEQMRQPILDDLNKFTSINKTAPLVIEDLDVIEKIRESKNGDQKILTIQDGNTPQDTESLAAKLGVGGTQALTAIMSDANIPDPQKRGLLSVLFGLGEEDIDKLFKTAK